MNDQVKTIDLTPTWRAAARIYIACLLNGTDEGKRNAEEGIMEMAEKLDRVVEESRKPEPRPDPKMKTLFFRVVGTGRFPMDQLRRFMLYPADVETAERIATSYDPNGPWVDEKYRLAMNDVTEYAIPSIIDRFASFGFTAEAIDEFDAL